MEVVEQHCNEDNKANSSRTVQPEAFFEKAYELASKIAATGLGQFAITKIDRVLSALEKTAKWSLPHSESTDKDTPPIALERPLPWIPFLATIIALRAVRLSVSFASVLIGNDPITPTELVYFLQTRRRKLRAIKYHGLRAIRMKKQDSLDRQRRGVIGKLGSIFGSVVCRTGYRSDSPVRVVVKRKKSKKSPNKVQKSVLNANKSQENKVSQNDEDENESDDELQCEQMLDKYAQLSDKEDSDFVLEDSLEESSEDSEIAEENQITEIEKRLIELNRKQQEDDLEQKKEIIDRMIQDKRVQIENEIKNKLESQIEERIEKHAQALKAKFDEKIEEIQGSHENSSPIENPSSVSINPAKLSPKIAHNGNAEENKTEKHEKAQYDAIDFKGNDHYLVDEISIKLKLRSERGCENYMRQLSTGSSSEDVFFSPIGSPGPDKIFENHSPVKDFIKQRESLDSIESSVPFIENEVKTQLQVNLKQANNNKKPSSINTYKGVKGRKA